MNCEYICKKIHEAIIRYQRDNQDLTNSIIVIDIKQPTDDSSHIPKLEHNSGPT